MAEEKEKADYVGTENSKYGKIVVARALRGEEVAKLEDVGGADPNEVSWINTMTIVDHGPEGKGFKTQKLALDRIQEIATAALEGKTWDDLPGRTLPDYFVLRVQQTVRVRPVQRVELEFDTD